MAKEQTLPTLDEMLAGAMPENWPTKVLEFRLPTGVEEMADQMADLASEGALSEAQQKHYERFIKDMDMLAILRNCAKRVLTSREQDLAHAHP